VRAVGGLLRRHVASGVPLALLPLWVFFTLLETVSSETGMPV
jgi:hypothetical protein